MFVDSGYKGSSALTWQEAIDFAATAPWQKTLVCDALGGSADECRMGGELNGFAKLIYEVFLADIPECATGHVEACVGVAASVVPGGGFGKAGKAIEEAAKAAKVGDAAESGRTLWRLTKDGATAMKQGGPFNTTFYKSASDATWWTADKAGHGRTPVAFKVYEENSKGLQWIADADKYGNYIEGKWKGDTGFFIPWSMLKGVK